MPKQPTQKRKGPSVTVTEGFDRAIEHRVAAAPNDLEVWEVPDPLQEANDRAPNPNMRRRLLSEHAIKHRGMRGWSPVKDANGELIRVGDQFLAEMPIRRADTRNEYYRSLGEAERDAAVDRSRESMERAVHDGKAVGDIRPLRAGERSNRDGRAPVTGVTRTRGDSHFPDAA